jgi:hypothetical protein
MAAANYNPSLDVDTDLQEVGNESMDRSGSSSRPSSPTLVLPSLLTRQSPPLTDLPVPTVQQSLHRNPEISKTHHHEANSSISTTRSTLSEWEMQEGNSLKLRPEHAMFLEDVLDSSIEV